MLIEKKQKNNNFNYTAFSLLGFEMWVIAPTTTSERKDTTQVVKKQTSWLWWISTNCHVKAVAILLAGGKIWHVFESTVNNVYIDNTSFCVCHVYWCFKQQMWYIVRRLSIFHWAVQRIWDSVLWKSHQFCNHILSYLTALLGKAKHFPHQVKSVLHTACLWDLILI